MAPRSTQQFNDLRTSSINKIVKAALKLFSTQGYLSVLVSDIAREAGISQGLMYNYFKSKESLLLYIIEAMMRDMEEYMKGVELPKSPSESLKVVIESFFTMIQAKKEFWAMILPVMTQGSVSSKVGTTLSDFFTAAINQLQHIFKALGSTEPREEALKLGATMDGIAWHYFYIFPDKYPLKKMQSKLLKDYDHWINPKKK